MGFLSGLFGRKEPKTFAPPSDAMQEEIMLLAASGNYEGLARYLRSENPRVRLYMVGALVFAGRTRALGGNEYEMSLDRPLDARAVQALISLLKDSDPKVRQSAERELVSAGNTPEIAQALDDYRAGLDTVK